MRARDEQKPPWTRGRAGGQQEIEMKGPHMVESSGPFVKMIIVYELKSLNLHSDCHVMKITRSPQPNHYASEHPSCRHRSFRPLAIWEGHNFPAATICGRRKRSHKYEKLRERAIRSVSNSFCLASGKTCLPGGELQLV